MTAVSASIVTPAATSQAVAVPAATSGITFDDVLDIVNPLQHLPVIGTLYRAITGDQIKPFPKLAGDMLYGGVMGFVGSIADMIFERVTGHNVGDTVLAAVEDVTGIHPSFLSPGTTPPAATGVASNTAVDTAATPVASAAPQLTAPAVVGDASLETLVVPGQAALMTALAHAGVGADVAARAADAYRRTLHVANSAATQAVDVPGLRAALLQ